MNVEADSCSHSIAVVLCDGTVPFAVTNLGPAPKLTPTGRIKRTLTEIRAEAQRKRDELQAKRDRKAAGRLAKRRADAEAKQLRAGTQLVRRKAAEMKRIERERKQRDREIRGRHVITPKPKAPRHVYAERLQDDPEKAFSNHIIDENSLDYEDMLIARYDGELVDEETGHEQQEITLHDRIFFGTDLADHVVFLALELDMNLDEVMEMLGDIADEAQLALSYDETLTPKRRQPMSKIGGGYFKSDIPNEFHYSIEARRGNGWKVHGRFAQYA